MERMMIVAEIGCNHNGSRELASKMVAEAKACGVDAVKFQTFQASELISAFAPKAEYQKKTTGEDDSQLEMTRKLELSHEDYLSLRDEALALGLEVFSTPFDLGSIDFLASKKQSIWKIPSGEITNRPYLERIGNLDIAGKRVILSTGMAILPEIREAVDILLDRGMKRSQITILHCNTEYPTPDEDVNLWAIKVLKKEFPEHPVGLSDHSVGSVAAVGAVALGATMIEKHFTLDKNMPGPDHKASATPQEMKDLVLQVRRAIVLCGMEEKKVTDSERKNMIVARKSIVAVRDIRKGTIFTTENITCKRPGNGISPMKWYEVLGKSAERDFKQDELISVVGIMPQESD